MFSRSFIEPLEPRQLLSAAPIPTAGATYDPDTHTVYVTGTNGDDEISAWGSGWGSGATVNGQRYEFGFIFTNYVPIDNIVIDALAGNDHITYDDDRGIGMLVRNSTIRGGTGDDTIDITYGWELNLLVDAGNGNDTIHYTAQFYAPDSNATLLGGNGDDTIDILRSHLTTLLADAGNGSDTITSRSFGDPYIIRTPATLCGNRGDDSLSSADPTDLLYPDQLPATP